MKIEEIKTIVELMSSHDLTEFKISGEDCNLCIKRGCDKVAQIQTVMPSIAPVMQQAPAIAQAPVAAATVAPAVVDDPAKQITSPLVGSFYRSASPEAAPFVQVGTKVTEDTTVCIIEAMKVMNEVKAEKSGIIKEVLIDNGQAVEYGQVLFVIE